MNGLVLYEPKIKTDSIVQVSFRRQRIVMADNAFAPRAILTDIKENWSKILLYRYKTRKETKIIIQNKSRRFIGHSPTFTSNTKTLKK